MGAGPSESKGSIDFPLDLVQGIKHAVGSVNGDLVVNPLHFFAYLWVVATNHQGHGKARNFGNYLYVINH